MKLRWKSVFRFLAVISLLVFIVFLLHSYISVERLPMLGILSPFTPYVLAFTVPVLLITLLFKEVKLTSLAVLLFLLSLPSLFKWVSVFNSSSNESASFEMISYNCSFFNFPALFGEDYLNTTYQHDVYEVMPWILQQSYEIVCLQEFFNDKYSPVYNSLNLIEKAGYEYYYGAVPNTKNGTTRGIVTMSTFPIVDSGLVTQSETNIYNGAIYTDLKVESDTLRVINAHLTSTSYVQESGLRKVIGFYRNYTNASRERSRQMDEIIKFILASPFPVMLAGDLNETPFSNNFRKLESHLSNCQQMSGSGVGNTFDFNDWLGVRIDHMFVGDEVESIRFDVVDSMSYSAHYPIVGSFRL